MLLVHLAEPGVLRLLPRPPDLPDRVLLLRCALVQDRRGDPEVGVGHHRVDHVVGEARPDQLAADAEERLAPGLVLRRVVGVRPLDDEHPRSIRHGVGQVVDSVLQPSRPGDLNLRRVEAVGSPDHGRRGERLDGIDPVAPLRHLRELRRPALLLLQLVGPVHTAGQPHDPVDVVTVVGAERDL